MVDMVRVRLLSGEAVGALVAVNNSGITVYDCLCLDDEITAEFSLAEKDLVSLQNLCRRKGYTLKLLKRRGMLRLSDTLRKRPVLVGVILLLLGLTLFVPTRVLFVRVMGNEQLPTEQILWQCAQNGIVFGTSRKEVRSEKVKNSLLEDIPQLQWVGVTTSGCVATVTVKERSVTEEAPNRSSLSCIVARYDGQIISQTITRGTAVCSLGQSVRAGDLLVSGYADGGNFLRLVGAEGEIYGRTSRQLSAIAPQNWLQKGSMLRQEIKYSLLIGKKRINFYKGSGISGVTCDKIYEEKYVTLPGGFRLPIAIVKECWIYREERESDTDMQGLLSSFADAYLRRQMIAGTIETRMERFAQTDDVCLLQGDYICTELIGQIQNEEIVKPYGNDN